MEQLVVKWFPSYSEMRHARNPNWFHSAFVGTFVSIFNWPIILLEVLLGPLLFGTKSGPNPGIIAIIITFFVASFYAWIVFPIFGLMGQMATCAPIRSLEPPSTGR